MVRNTVLAEIMWYLYVPRGTTGLFLQMDHQNPVTAFPVPSQESSNSTFCFMTTTNVVSLLHSGTPVDQKNDTAPRAQK